MITTAATNAICTGTTLTADNSIAAPKIASGGISCWGRPMRISRCASGRHPSTASDCLAVSTGHCSSNTSPARMRMRSSRARRRRPCRETASRLTPYRRRRSRLNAVPPTSSDSSMTTASISRTSSDWRSSLMIRSLPTSSTRAFATSASRPPVSICITRMSPARNSVRGDGASRRSPSRTSPSKLMPFSTKALISGSRLRTSLESAGSLTSVMYFSTSNRSSVADWPWRLGMSRQPISKMKRRPAMVTPTPTGANSNMRKGRPPA